MAGILSVLLVAFGLYYTNLANREQQRLTEQGQLIDRFTKATDQLGSKVVEVRLGAIYSLDRIMHRSNAEAGPIIEVLCAYIRNHAHRARGPVTTPTFTTTVPDPAPSPIDIQAVISILSHRPVNDTRINLGLSSLAGADFDIGTNLRGADLHETDLSGAGLVSADMFNANLTGASLAGAYLANVDLDASILVGTNLTGAGMAGADLSDVDLTNANLSHAQMDDTSFIGSDLTGASLNSADFGTSDLSGARLTNADLRGADLSKTKGLSMEQLSTTRVSSTTKLPEGMDVPSLTQTPGD